MQKTHVSPSRWLLSPKMTAEAEVLLFSFHYAGGHAGIYREWQKKLPVQIGVCPVQLPGRSNRFMEPYYTDLSVMIRELAEALLPHLNRPFAFFGHSMGALVSFELARYLRNQYGLKPRHMFASGRHAPHLPDPGEAIHHLPDAEFLKGLRTLNGTPKELFENEENEEILQMLLPMLRADFTICEQYQYQEEEPLGCGLTAIGGWQDPDITVAHMEAWRKHTSASFQMHMLQGDHFFLHSEQEQLLAIIESTLQSYLVGYRGIG
ncbi:MULTISPECIES: linear gramicidin aldoreductase LgrE [Brevibacillus]|uniref:linear gramicidin aldoreductase LgrE n=1 Tax=Brevibacillus TaxID=55080 RepID=UPI002380736E|nr:MULTISPECIES: linear gramicidin aldoreductase LgrE [Brevibacillus]MDH6349562.1 medium-chain acyl-[acyl-carrier-protein] hydrolase [Brevibacillus sp. 1238]WDV98005.1 linear gramicidin aldoreductase LgrE [Brevibacillus parabrevis]